MPSGHELSNRVAIVGASSLRGKELKLVLEERNFPTSDIVLLDEPVVAGTLTQAGGEPTVIRALDEESFEGARFAFFAGSQIDAEQNWKAAQRSGATVIDLTGTLAASGQSTSWIPALSTLLLPHPGSYATEGAAPGSHAANRATSNSYSSPGSGVIVACTVAAALSKLSPMRTVLLLFPPVSERDQAGVDELESQTANLLSFRPIAQPVFDAQVAFNLLAGYGEECKPTLADLRAAIARDTSDYLAGRVAVPALQLVQAPVFYGYAVAAYAEFASPPQREQLEAAFASLGVKVGVAGDPAPTNVSVAGENEIHIARVEPDPSVAGGVWIWGVADNLRLAAVNAVRIAEELVAKPAVQ
ncbi:MAG TPA: Asd/ArgC dimerization domain-containing protein [Candidatus Acidoferrales bacterium]|nr:Asd/ArgC dimerization domain-containing protein [Candidatus Acidoferrales bacterium]